MNRCARDVDEFKYVAEADDDTDSERLGAFFAERYHLDVGNVASCVAGGDFASSTFGSTDFSMHSTGRPSSVHETGLLGFANEYYREFSEDSSTLQAFFASVLSSGTTASRTSAINNLLRGDDVRAAYADEEMDENKIGCYRLLYSARSALNDLVLSAGALIDSGGSNTVNTARLYPVEISFWNVEDVPMGVYRVIGGSKVPGRWVLIDGRCWVHNNILSESSVVRGSYIGLWHRYA